MILMHEPSPIGNIIRLVIGKETEASIAVQGCTVINLTPVLENIKNFDVGNPNVLLSIAMVESEVDTLNMLRHMELQPPYQAPLIVVSPQLIDKNVIPQSNTNNTKDNKMEPTLIKIVKGTCDYCKANDVNVIASKATKPICDVCFVLNMGLSGQVKPGTVTTKPRKVKSKDCDEPKGSI